MPTSIDANQAAKAMLEGNIQMADRLGYSMKPLYGAYETPYETTYADGSPATVYTRKRDSSQQGGGFGNFGSQFWGNSRMGFKDGGLCYADGGLARSPEEISLEDDYTFPPFEDELSQSPPLMVTDPRIAAMLNELNPQELQALVAYVNGGAPNQGPYPQDTDIDALMTDIE